MKKIFGCLVKAYYRHPLRSAALSAVISYLGYAWLFGWQLAAGIIFLLLVHEGGHFAMARAFSVKTGVPFLIPFLGAVVDIKENVASPLKEAAIALGGPLAGTFGAALFAFLYEYFYAGEFLLLAYVGSLLNLFNLVPSEPLDGGRIALAISPRLWWAGIIITGLLAVYTMSLFIWLIFIFALVRMWSFDYIGEKEFYNSLERSKKGALLAAYLGLIGISGSLIVWVGQILRLF